jgi:hypothetical protein
MSSSGLSGEDMMGRSVRRQLMGRSCFRDKYYGENFAMVSRTIS